MEAGKKKGNYIDSVRQSALHDGISLFPEPITFPIHRTLEGEKRYATLHNTAQEGKQKRQATLYNTTLEGKKKTLGNTSQNSSGGEANNVTQHFATQHW